MVAVPAAPRPPRTSPPRGPGTFRAAAAAAAASVPCGGGEGRRVPPGSDLCVSPAGDSGLASPTPPLPPPRAALQSEFTAARAPSVT